MAITDNTFSLEELDAAVAANPALKDHLVGGVKKLGYVARTAAEENSFIGSKTKEIYDALDNDIFTTSGIAKQPTEKTYDFAKRVIGGYKTAVTEATTPLQTKIADLEKKISEGSGDTTLKAQLEDLQKKEADYQKKIEDSNTQLFQKDIMLDIRDGLRGVKLNESIPESLQKLAVDNATNAIVGMAAAQKNADGTESVVYIRDGKTVLNEKSLPADVAFILNELLKDVVETGQTGAGGGAGQGGNGGAGKDRKAIPTALPSTIKNQSQLMTYLKEFGLAEGSKEYDEAYDKFSEGLPLR